MILQGLVLGTHMRKLSVITTGTLSRFFSGAPNVG